MFFRYMLRYILTIILVFSFFVLVNYRIEDFSLDRLHRDLTLNYGEFTMELPEQQMIYKHIEPDSRILEFGPNIGRSSLIANSRLSDKSQHLCIETIPETCQQLIENRDANALGFQVFQGAISQTPLYQKGWKTSTEKKKGYRQVNTQSFGHIRDTYAIDFNTIIADCEGCLVPFLKDNPEILNDIRLIILEHDFNQKEEIVWFYQLMKKKGLKMVDKIEKKSGGFGKLGRWSPLRPYFC